MKVKLLCLPLLLVLACAGAFAQGQPYTPPPGSVERQMILSALRPVIEKELKQEVIFRVDQLKVLQGWAFMMLAPQRPDGGPVDLSETRYREADEAGAFDNSVIALMRWQGNRWRVVQYVIGATDVPYEGWPRRYRAPRAIFGF